MTNEPERTATCGCGQLRVTAVGDPDIVVACSCFECQRRTGSPFGVGAYYPREKVRAIGGSRKAYRRGTDSGRTLTTSFCTECGTSVFWELDMRPQHLGVAVGCFNDPDFPKPARLVWAENSHRWLAFPDEMPVFEKAAT